MTMAKFLSGRTMQRTDEVVKYSYSRDEEALRDRVERQQQHPVE
jgi:hypothetical protein